MHDQDLGVSEFGDDAAFDAGRSVEGSDHNLHTLDVAADGRAHEALFNAIDGRA